MFYETFRKTVQLTDVNALMNKIRLTICRPTAVLAELCIKYELLQVSSCLLVLSCLASFKLSCV